MNVENWDWGRIILFWEYINGIFVAVYAWDIYEAEVLQEHEKSGLLNV